MEAVEVAAREDAEDVAREDAEAVEEAGVVEIAPPTGELYANPSASQAMLDDATFDVEDWLAGEIAVEFAKAEGTAFVNGNGTNRPKGFLQAPTAATAVSTTEARSSAVSV